MNYTQALNNQNAELAELRAYKCNCSKVMKRAHWMSKNRYMTLGEAITKCYEEYRTYKDKVVARIRQLIKHITSRYNVEMSNTWVDDFEMSSKLNPNFNPYNK